MFLTLLEWLGIAAGIAAIVVAYWGGWHSFQAATDGIDPAIDIGLGVFLWVLATAGASQPA